MQLTCIAVEDEPLALGLVCAYIEKTHYLKLGGRFSNTLEAMAYIHNNKVDLIFLDIQMPDLNGMEMARLLNQVPGQSKPRIIFTTAYNHFALDGYKVDAIDYLLKPFNYEEFLRASQKALTFYELINPAAPSGQQPLADDYLFLKVEYKMIKISFGDILYVEGLKDYVKVMLESSPKPVLSLSSLKSLEQKLPPGKFMRVHRSFIIALNKIKSLTRSSVTIGQADIPVGDQYKEVFGKFLEERM